MSGRLRGVRTIIADQYPKAQFVHCVAHVLNLNVAGYFGNTSGFHRDTTATPERSFSTLKRLKTYLRNKMGDKRLTGLALLSVHRDLAVQWGPFTARGPDCRYHVIHTV
nr:uncharacterized protein LOC122273036 [Parasteatoda tepidariorum]